MADGPAPVGDAVYVAGLGALGFLTLLELGYNAISSSVSSTTVDGVSGASVKAFNNTVHQKQLSDIASKYGLYECKEAAEAMAKQDNNKKGYLIQLYFPNAYNGNVCAPNSEYGWKTAISKNSVHWGYCDEFGIVHCNVFPLGLPEAEWIHSFADAWESDPIVTRIPVN